jgi:hypothetical protein
VFGVLLYLAVLLTARGYIDVRDIIMRHKTEEAFLKNRRKKGIALVWSAIMLIVLVLIMGIAIDASRVHLTANQLQNAADAAALAGARTVRIDHSGNYLDSRTRAQYIGGLNSAMGDPVSLNLNTNNDPCDDIVIGRYSFTTEPRFTPTNSSGLPKPNAMKVVARRITDGKGHQPLPLIFGPIAHVDTANVSRYAIAQGQGGLGAGLIVLSENPADAPSLIFNGNPQVEIIDGSVQVNMIDPFDPVNLGGSQTLVSADEFNVVSKTDSTGGYVFDPATGLTVTTGQPKIPDPYSSVPTPAPNPSTPKVGDIPTGGVPVTFEPGYYPDGFGKISTGDNVTFKPGIYWVGHKNPSVGLDITGGNVCAKRVMFYIAPGAAVIVTGSQTANITITEINTVDPGIGCDGNTITYSQGDSYVAPYKGMSIFQSRTNSKDATVGGGSGLNIQGTLYFPINHVKLSGGSGSLGIEVIAWTLTIDGTGPGNDKLLISYDGRNKKSPNRAYLVE